MKRYTAEVTREFILVDEIGDRHNVREVTDYIQVQDSSGEYGEKVASGIRYSGDFLGTICKYGDRYRITCGEGTTTEVRDARELEGEA